MKKLTLNKETIANLSSQEMNVVKGLTGNTCGGACNDTTTCPYPTVNMYTCPAVCIL